VPRQQRQCAPPWAKSTAGARRRSSPKAGDRAADRSTLDEAEHSCADSAGVSAAGQTHSSAILEPSGRASSSVARRQPPGSTRPGMEMLVAARSTDMSRGTLAAADRSAVTAASNCEFQDGRLPSSRLRTSALSAAPGMRAGSVAARSQRWVGASSSCERLERF